MPRPKSFMHMTAQELQDLREAIEQENARRALLSGSNESIMVLVEATRKTARELKVDEHDLLQAIVAIVLPKHDIYLKRGRAAAAAGSTKRGPGRPKKK